MNIRLKLTRINNNSAENVQKASENLEKAKPKHDPEMEGALFGTL